MYEDERIIQQGSLDNEFYVIRSGEVKFSIDMDGTDTAIGALEAGRFFGEGTVFFLISRQKRIPLMLAIYSGIPPPTPPACGR